MPSAANKWEKARKQNLGFFRSFASLFSLSPWPRPQVHRKSETCTRSVNSGHSAASRPSSNLINLTMALSNATRCFAHIEWAARSIASCWIKGCLALSHPLMDTHSMLQQMMLLWWNFCCSRKVIRGIGTKMFTQSSGNLLALSSVLKRNNHIGLRR